MPPDPHPPAIVRESAELKEMAWQIKADLDAGGQKVKAGLDIVRKAGETLLKAKALMKRGDWGGWLLSNKIDSQRASEAMRIAAHWTKIPESGSMRGAVRALTEFEEPQIPGAGDLSQQGPSSLNKVTSSGVATTFESRFCDRCQRVGPAKDCPQCAMLAKIPFVYEPGDDSDAIEGEEAARKAKNKAAGKPGQVLIDWRRYFTTYGVLAKLPDKIADAYPKEANSPDFHAMLRTLNVLAESMEDWQMKITNFPAWCKKHKRPVPKGE